MTLRPAGPRLTFLTTALLATLALAWLYAHEVSQRAGFALDAFHHMAAVRELAKGEFPPRHNLVAGHGPQGHYGPYLLALGWCARLLDASPLAVLNAAGLVNMWLHVLLFGALAARLVGPAAWRFAAVTPLLLWGPWPGLEMGWPSLGWPGTTSLAEPWNFFYPNQAGLLLVMAVILILVDRAGRLRAEISLGRGLLALAVSGTLVASHPLSALLLVAALMALGLDALVARRAALGPLAWLVALPPGGLGMAAPWPYYPVLKLFGAFGIPWFRGPLARPSASPAAEGGGVPALGLPLAAPGMPLLQVFGPAVAGAAGLAILARRGKCFPLFWLVLCIAVTMLPLIPMRHRFALFAVIPLHLGAIALFEWAWLRGRLARAAVLLAFACGAFAVVTRLIWVLDHEPQRLDFVARLTPEDAVILANPSLSNGVAGLAGRKVVCPENPDVLLILAGGARRIWDVGFFLRPRTRTEAREAILRRWRVSHVLLDRFAPFPLKLPYPVVYEGEGYVLYDVRSVLNQPAAR